MRFSVRYFSSLRQKHSQFLSLVSQNGLESGACVKRRYENSVYEIILSNPKKKNSLNGKMMNDFADIMDDVLFQTKPSYVVLRGEGEFFCSGADLSLAVEELNNSENALLMSNFMTEALNSLRNSDSISVCVLNGPALGGGLELTTSCDFRIMNKEKSYIQSVHALVGASPGWGGAKRLYSIVGRQHTLRMLGTSKKIFSEEALRIGLVDDLFDLDENCKNTDPALNFLEPYLKQTFQRSVRGMKSIIGAADTNEMEIIEKQLFGSLWMGPENKSVVEKFMKKK